MLYTFRISSNINTNPLRLDTENPTEFLNNSLNGDFVNVRSNEFSNGLKLFMLQIYIFFLITENKVINSR